jgi:hypothetical protein
MIFPLRRPACWPGWAKRTGRINLARAITVKTTAGTGLAKAGND